MGIVLWGLTAAYLVKHTIWIPELSYWERLRICLEKTFLIPLIFLGISVLFYTIYLWDQSSR